MINTNGKQYSKGEKSKMDKAKELIDMIAELEEYYECAGFADFYNRVLKNMTEEQIRDYYNKTLREQPDRELEMWERKYNEMIKK